MKIKRCFSSAVMGPGPDVSVKDGDVRRKGEYEGLREKLERTEHGDVLLKL